MLSCAYSISYWIGSKKNRGTFRGKGALKNPLALPPKAHMSLSQLVRDWLLSPLTLDFHSLERKITMNHEQLATAITEIAAQAEKAKAEIVAQVVTLEAAIVAAGSTTPAVDTALAALKATVQGIDDLNADPVPAPVVPV